jgi:mRNA interferase HigB
MVVISYKTIREFADRYPDSEDALNNWYTIMGKSDFANFNNLRKMFNSADAVGNDLYVFNIRGNRYRLVVRILFRVRTVYIKFVGTHSQYDRLKMNDL